MELKNFSGGTITNKESLILDVKSSINAQRQFFNTGATFPADFRLSQLKKLLGLLKSHEGQIARALKLDLNKPAMEAVAAEVLIVQDELNFIIKHLEKWMRPEKVASPFPLCFPGKSFIHAEPYGCALIMGPWNYPFSLTMSPLIGAMCAGNCVIIKPSELASHTEEFICNLINQHFPSEYINAIRANPVETSHLLEEKFDYIFFTGGSQIGKIVMQAAAKHLTPVTLELGGKNPCIVDNTVDLDYASRRIIWGKFMNAGQICLAPDYLLVHESIKDKFIPILIKTIKQFYGDNAENSPSYCRIINKKHFERLIALLKNGSIVYGGGCSEEKLYISPTLIENVSFRNPLMQEEIFGPILPILTYNNNRELINTLKPLPKSLALYIFTKNKTFEKSVLSEISFGGGCVNDCILQVANYHLPFGGVGTSGMGSYHGKYSFDTFSHHKAIFRRPFQMDISLAYPPYTWQKLKWIKRLLK